MARPTEHDAEFSAVQMAALRRATTGQRLALARKLSATSIALARAAIRRSNPGIDERDCLLRFAELHYGAELAARIRQHIESRAE